MYSLCLEDFAACRQKPHLHCLNSYNWPLEGKHNADMALNENEFDTSATVQQNERRSRLAFYLTSSEMV